MAPSHSNQELIKNFLKPAVIIQIKQRNVLGGMWHDKEQLKSFAWTRI